MNEALEKSMLCMLFSNEDLLNQYNFTEDDFWSELHKKIFRLLKLYWWNVEILNWKLSPDENDYLIEVITELVNLWNFKQDFEELKRLAEMRRLKSVNKQVQLALDSDSSMEVIREKIQKYEKNEQKETNIEQSINNIIDVLDWNVIPVVFPTNYNALDSYLWWWFIPWQLNILAARPSKWKTMFATCIMLNMLAKWIKTAYFSLEMTTQQMTERILANNSWVAVASMKKKATPEQYERIIEAMNKILGYTDSLDLIDFVFWIGDMARQIKYLVKKKWTQVFFIDYLQLMAKWDNKYAEISKITRTLKMLAIQLDITIVCLSQLNRWLEWRADTEPRLSDLRDSWSIEQDADIVIMIDRDIYDHSNDMSVFIRKNRNGSCWEFTLQVLPASMQIWNKPLQDKPF